MKYTFSIRDIETNKLENVQSNYLPEFKEINGDIFLVIYGKEVEYRYYPTSVRISCIFQLI